MSYTCSLDLDYDPRGFTHSSTRRARKSHTCEECAGVIRPGETYHRHTVKHEGDIHSHKWCERCQDIERHMTAHVPCFSYYYGDMHAHALECAAEVSADVPGFYFETARKIVATRRAAVASHLGESTQNAENETKTVGTG